MPFNGIDKGLDLRIKTLGVDLIVGHGRDKVVAGE